MTEREAKQNRIKELIATLNAASVAYYDDAKEIMSNLEYDSLYDELEALERETGIVTAGSPTQNVGYTVTSGLPKERHASRMLSLDKTKSVEELADWLGDKEGLLSWKLDGLTVVLTYERGRLSKAVTRGNGDVGEVITENAKVFENVPHEIPFTGRLVVRGEAVIKYSDFEKINAGLGEDAAKYKNPRNLCSGSVRQLNSRITAERKVNFFAFTLSRIENIEGEKAYPAELDLSRERQMKWMSGQGFDAVEFVRVDSRSIASAVASYEERIPSMDIPSDGLVLTYDDIEYSKTLGTTAKFPRDAIAFKWQDQQERTILREIEWSPSRTGLLNPIAIFAPVELEGTTVKRASVHNLNILEGLQLGIGDEIAVYKANMIIPQIAENFTRSGKLTIPSRCPVCGGGTAVKTDVGTKVLLCTNPECVAKKVKKFTHFVSRDAMNIEGLSEATILKFMGQGFIKSTADIFRLADHRDYIVNMDGFGEKSYENLTASIEKARKTSPARLLYALGINGIGVATAKTIADAYNDDWGAIAGATAESLVSIEGIGDVTARDYTEYFREEANIAEVSQILSQIEIQTDRGERGNALAGKIFVITGSLEHFSNRSDLKSAIEKEGGKVASSVTGKTDYLITNDPGSGSTKNKTARELGVEIIDEDTVLKMLKR